MQDINSNKDNQKRIFGSDTQKLKQFDCDFCEDKYYHVTEKSTKSTKFNILLPLEYDFLSFLIDAQQRHIHVNVSHFCPCQSSLLDNLLQKNYIDSVTRKKIRIGGKTVHVRTPKIIPKYVREYELGRLKPYYPDKAFFECLIFGNGKYDTIRIKAHHENDIFNELADLLNEELISPHAWIYHKLLNINVMPC